MVQMANFGPMLVCMVSLGSGSTSTSRKGVCGGIVWVPTLPL